MAERLRGITLLMVVAMALFEGVSYVMAMGGTTVPFLVGLGIFAAVGLAAGYKAYDEMASNSDVIETVVMFIVIIAVLSFLVSALFYGMSSVGSAISGGKVTGSQIAEGAGMTLFESNIFTQVFVLLVAFVGSWFILTVTKRTEPGG
ncbi:Uncharacterised protein [uncultured archaeon]|nr:Uncharacterised protein [uncultured archaeon]